MLDPTLPIRQFTDSLLNFSCLLNVQTKHLHFVTCFSCYKYVVSMFKLRYTSDSTPKAPPEPLKKLGNI